jgi:CBS domain-containing protein
MLIKDLLQSKPPPVTVRANREMTDAMRLLIDNNIGSLVVTNEDDHPVGIITERDIFHLAFRYRGDMMDMRVGENMTDNLTVGSPEDDLEHIARLMTERHIRHVPIVDQNEQLCGIVSIGDVVKARLNEPAV